MLDGFVHSSDQFALHANEHVFAGLNFYAIQHGQARDAVSRRVGKRFYIQKFARAKGAA
jgi:hypothetical protein